MLINIFNIFSYLGINPKHKVGKCHSVQSCSDCVKSYDNVTNECVWSPANERCQSKHHATKFGYAFVQNCNEGTV